MPNFLKDLHRLMKRVNRLTDGQVTIEHVDWDDPDALESVTICIKPDTGYYKDGIFKFQVSEFQSYNNGEPPEVVCLTSILHPNIDKKDGYICLNILEKECWLPSIGLEGLVLALLFLLQHPNFDDPLIGEFENKTIEQRDELLGKYVSDGIDGYEFVNENALKKVSEDTKSVDKDSVKGEEEAMEVDTENIMSIEAAVKLHNFSTVSETEELEEHDSVCALPRSSSLRYGGMERLTLKSSRSCFPNFGKNADLFKTKIEEPKLADFDGETVIMF